MPDAADDQAPPRRPALVDELERMGFTPVGDSAVPTTQVQEQGLHITSTPVAGSYDGAADERLEQALASHASRDEPRSVVPSSLDGAKPAGRGAVRMASPATLSATAQPPTAQPATTAPDTTPPVTTAPDTTPPAVMLTADTVLRTQRAAPAGGWRRAVFAGSFGTIDPGPSAAELAERDLIERATRPVPARWRVAVLSLKGGVGKTTTTAALGVQLALLRGDRVIAVDANPDRGTLAEKVPQVNPATVRDLLRDKETITHYSDVRAYTSLAPSRLEVLGSDADPTASQAFTDQDYRAAIEVLEHFYSVILTDCGTGLLHSAMSGVLGLADALIVVTSANLDGARSASATLDWLEAHGRAELVQQSVAVVSSVRPGGGLVDVDVVEEHFAGRCRAVVRVPFDPHLEAGAAIDMAALRKPTRLAYLRLAAAVGDGMPH